MQFADSSSVQLCLPNCTSVGEVESIGWTALSALGFAAVGHADMVTFTFTSATILATHWAKVNMLRQAIGLKMKINLNWVLLGLFLVMCFFAYDDFDATLHAANATSVVNGHNGWTLESIKQVLWCILAVLALITFLCWWGGGCLNDGGSHVDRQWQTQLWFLVRILLFFFFLFFFTKFCCFFFLIF